MNIWKNTKMGRLNKIIQKLDLKLLNYVFIKKRKTKRVWINYFMWLCKEGFKWNVGIVFHCVKLLCICHSCYQNYSYCFKTLFDYYTFKYKILFEDIKKKEKSREVSQYSLGSNWIIYLLLPFISIDKLGHQIGRGGLRKLLQSNNLME